MTCQVSNKVVIVIKNGRQRHKQKQDTYDSEYESQSEREAAKAENETAIKNGENIRFDHSGQTYSTLGPTSFIENR